MIWEPNLLVIEKMSDAEIIRLANVEIMKERERCAKIVEAHKAICKNMHDDCAAQVAGEIRDQIQKTSGK